MSNWETYYKDAEDGILDSFIQFFKESDVFKFILHNRDVLARRLQAKATGHAKDFDEVLLIRGNITGLHYIDILINESVKELNSRKKEREKKEKELKKRNN